MATNLDYKICIEYLNKLSSEGHKIFNWEIIDNILVVNIDDKTRRIPLTNVILELNQL